MIQISRPQGRASQEPGASFLRDAWQHPRRLLLRRALFQVHLWLGISLALWVIAIGLSGSALVFEQEVDRWAMAPSDELLPPVKQQADVGQVVATAEASSPGSYAFYVTTPVPDAPFFEVWLHRADEAGVIGTYDPRTGATMQAPHPRAARLMNMAHDFHVDLLAGPRGLAINGVLSAALLVLALTGIFLWWPGVRHWTLRLRVSFTQNRQGRLHWRRLNFDLHHAVGFWTLAWSLLWALSSVYFAFPAAVQGLAGLVSPVVAMQSPTLLDDQGRSAAPGLRQVLTTARMASPGHFLSGVSLPSSPGANYVVTLDTGRAGDFLHRDLVTISARTGRVLGVWHYGRNRTASDHLLWLMYLLHYGTLWGLIGKIVWAVLGLTLPILAVTGLLMYWNRFLHKYWRALR